jgi:hypothetical protein
MNERIYELALQAEIAAHNGDHVDVKIMMAKFGALIVKEMLNISDAYCEVFQTDRDRALIEHIKQSVKTHFGVE